VARSLGLRDAMNLDGGGSTTMVVDGTVVNVPSDATGQRPVGDALVGSPPAIPTRVATAGQAAVTLTAKGLARGCHGVDAFTRLRRLGGDHGKHFSMPLTDMTTGLIGGSGASRAMPEKYGEQTLF
jgi:hypothetical protein